MQSLRNEFSRPFDMSGRTDRTAFRHVTPVMAVLLIASLLLPLLFVPLVFLLLPYTVIHARRLIDNGFSPALAHAIVWTVTLTFIALVIRVADSDGGLIPGREFTDGDLIAIGFTLGLYLVFIAFEYLFDNFALFLGLFMACMILLSGLCFTMIGLVSGSSADAAPRPSPDTTPQARSDHLEPWRQNTTPSPKRSRHD